MFCTAVASEMDKRTEDFGSLRSRTKKKLLDKCSYADGSHLDQKSLWLQPVIASIVISLFMRDCFMLVEDVSLFWKRAKGQANTWREKKISA